MTGSVDERAASPPDSAADSSIDWQFAERVAVRASGRTDFTQTAAAVKMPEEFRTLTSRSQELVEEFTGLRSLAGGARAEVIDRPAWIRANIAGFRHLLEPLARQLALAQSGHASGEESDEPHETDRGLGGAGRAISRKALGLELGLLLGFLSQRVLGQYDLLLPEEAAGAVNAGVVYYVGPNICQLERQHGFPPRDFRLWIALHEVTHRTQFTSVPWLRPYFLSLVDKGLGGFDLDPRKFFDTLNDIIDRFRRGENPLGDEGVVGLFATPSQREALDTMQALMTLLEGHGNFVMDELGKQHVRGQAEMSNTLRLRRRQGGLSRIILRLMGMEMKARQYEEGQKFVSTICERIGPRGLDPAWAGVENLPTIAELRGDPDGWIARMGSVSAP